MAQDAEVNAKGHLPGNGAQLGLNSGVPPRPRMAALMSGSLFPEEQIL